MLALALVLLVALALIAVHLSEAFRSKRCLDAECFGAPPLCNQYLGADFLSQSADPKHVNCIYRYNDHMQFTQGANVDSDVVVSGDINMGPKTLQNTMALAQNVRRRARQSKNRLSRLARRRSQFERRKLPTCAPGTRTPRNSAGCYYCQSSSGGRCTIKTRAPGAGGGPSEDRICRRPFCDHTQIKNLAAHTTYPAGIEISPGAATALETQGGLRSMSACREKCRKKGASCKAVMYNRRTQDCYLKSGTRIGGDVGNDLQGSVITTKSGA